MTKQLRIYLKSFKRNWFAKSLLFTIALFLITSVFLSQTSWPLCHSSQDVLDFNPLMQMKTVKTKKDLLNYDIVEKVEKQNWNKMGIGKFIKEYNYTERLQPGYLSNINLDFVKNSKRKQNDENNKEENGKGKHRFNQYIDSKYANIVDCADIEYNNTIESYKSRNELKIDFKSLRKEMTEAKNAFATEYTTEEENDMTEEKILSKRWYAFGSASVWLESENCYVTYTRAYYSKREDKKAPYISIVYAQAYDKDWNEIHDRRIFFRDIEVPKEIKIQVAQLESEMTTNLDKCNNFDINDKAKLESCQIDMNDANSKLQDKIDQLYDKYSVKYPSALNIPIFMNHIFNGPEDPHVVLRKDYEGEEPIVIFNMHIHKGRRVHAFTPHRKNYNLVEFDIENYEFKGMEKNWAPFVYSDTQKSSNNSPGFINFVYDLNPLQIIRCSLLTGHCNFIFKASALDLEKKKTGLIRGGTQFVPLPDILPKVKGKNIWVGFTKSHVNNCGCGKRFYRPALSLLVEENGIYHLELVAPNIDFKDGALSWSLKDTKCDDYNILSPSSIANWFISEQDPITKKFEDYLILTISEADAVSKVVYFRGILDYILGIYKDSTVNENFKLTLDSKFMIEKSSECLNEELRKYCKIYGLAH